MHRPLQQDASRVVTYGATAATIASSTSSTPSSWRHLRWASSPFRHHQGHGEIQLSSDDGETSTPTLSTPGSSCGNSPSSFHSANGITPPPPPPLPPSLRCSSRGIRRMATARQKRNKVLLLIASCLGIYTVILFVLWNKSILAMSAGGTSNSSSSSFSISSSSDTESDDDYYYPPSKHHHHSHLESSSYASKMKQFLFENFLPWGPFRSNSISPPSHTTRSILLVMHGEAVPESPYIPDLKRPLTENGIRDADELGWYLQEHNIEPPDWIFASPSVRTSYTLELIRRHWASDVPVAFEEILYILAFNDYFAFCAGLAFNFRRVLIVGHNPAILNTAKKLMAAHGIEDFPEAGLMELRWNHQELWMNLVPGTGDTELAVSPNNVQNEFFNVTVTKFSKKRRRREQLQQEQAQP
ncbi:phosphoglyceromutase [Nitzschia inconspicua]|uniref:Phosphoglyceromutase n=1 Tax=Nitzschia inconspicua TaxID=303405 RepID=A0A9K3Q957_9STRA|nr:phosphoglyceromutase [Nitzschia inconspicua]